MWVGVGVWVGVWVSTGVLCRDAATVEIRSARLRIQDT